MRLLITGTGRCGTEWIAKMLREAGVDCGHERAFDLERHNWGTHLAESSWLAAPYTPMKEAYTIHLVRHPLRVIESFVDRKVLADDPDPIVKEYGDFIREHLPEVDEGRDLVEKSAIYWVRWNQLIRRDYLLRLEDVTPETVRDLARVVHPDAPVPTPLPPSNARSEVRTRLAWNDVSHVPGLTTLALRYGYTSRDV